MTLDKNEYYRLLDVLQFIKSKKKIDLLNQKMMSKLLITTSHSKVTFDKFEYIENDCDIDLYSNTSEIWKISVNSENLENNKISNHSFYYGTELDMKDNGLKNYRLKSDTIKKLVSLILDKSLRTLSNIDKAFTKINQ